MNFIILLESSVSFIYILIIYFSSINFLRISKRSLSIDGLLPLTNLTSLAGYVDIKISFNSGFCSNLALIAFCLSLTLLDP